MDIETLRASLFQCGNSVDSTEEDGKVYIKGTYPKIGSTRVRCLLTKYGPCSFITDPSQCPNRTGVVLMADYKKSI